MTEREALIRINELIHDIHPFTWQWSEGHETGTVLRNISELAAHALEQADIGDGQPSRRFTTEIVDASDGERSIVVHAVPAHTYEQIWPPPTPVHDPREWT